MKSLILALFLGLALAGCAPKKGDPGDVGPKGSQGDAGAEGPAGPQGANGHSLVSETVAASALECAVSGQRLDIYVDLDDSLSLSAGDQFSSSLISCNGANGLDGAQGVAGEQGPQGEVGPEGLMGAEGPQGAEGPTGPQGVQGPQGAQGAQGPAGSGATIQNYTLNTSTCLSIGDSLYAKRNSTDVRVYSASNCNGASLVAQIDGEHPVFLTGDRLGFNVNGGNLRVLKFN